MTDLTGVPNDDGFFDVVKDLGEIPVDQDAVHLRPEHQATYLAVEALSQCIASLHATSDVLAILGDAYPQAEQVLREGPLPFLYDEGREGEDRLATLDTLTSWSVGFAHDLAAALGSWLEAHHMPEHIHLWVNLPVIGFMPVIVGYGETNLDMPIPRGFLYPDKE